MPQTSAVLEPEMRRAGRRSWEEGGTECGWGKGRVWAQVPTREGCKRSGVFHVSES